jgi:hypothetical protein
VIVVTHKLSTCSFLIPIAERGGMVDLRGVTTEIYSQYLPSNTNPTFSSPNVYNFLKELRGWMVLVMSQTNS